LNGLNFKIQYPLPVEYKGVRLNCGYRVDILVEDEILLELKRVEALKGIHEAQLLTYMKLGLDHHLHHRVGWVERSETQHFVFVGFRSSTQPTFHALAEIMIKA
jgi:hypothetical protein